MSEHTTDQHSEVTPQPISTPIPQQNETYPPPAHTTQGLAWQIAQIKYCWEHPALTTGWWVVSLACAGLISLTTILIYDSVRDWRWSTWAEPVSPAAQPTQTEARSHEL